MRGKATSISLGVTGIILFAVAAFPLRNMIVEGWYLWKLEDERDTGSLLNAITNLGEYGTEKALLRLHKALASRPSGGLELAWINNDGAEFGMDFVTGTTTVPDPAAPRVHYHRLKSLHRLEKRLGPAIVVQAFLRAIENGALEHRTRVYLSAHIVLRTSKIGTRTVEFPSFWDELIATHPGMNWTEYSFARPRMIRVMISTLNSDDNASREGAARVLGWCGREASAALHDLENLRNDDVEDVRLAASEAVQRIEAP